METMNPAGASSARYNLPTPNFVAPQDAQRSVVARPERRAEDPFAAANGTLHFSTERKAASQKAAQTGNGTAVAAARTGAGGSGSTGSRSTGAKRSASSGGSKQPPKKRRRKKKNKRLMLFAFGFLLFALIVLIGTILLLNYFACGGRERCQSGEESPSTSAQPADRTPAPASDDRIITANAVINGVAVQNLTVREARTRVAQKLEQDKASVQITVSYEEYHTTLTADDLGLDYTEALENALADAADGDGSKTLTAVMSFDPDRLRSSLYSLNEQIPNHATNAVAELVYEYNKIDGTTYAKPKWVFHEGVNGAQLDYDSVESGIAEALKTGSFTASLTPAVTVSEPDRTANDLKSEISLLGSYTTNYRFKGSSSTDAATVENCMARDHNISKAIAMMQYIELKPGKTWSFNDRTGERSEQKGWSLANAVYQGKGYRKEPGGGVCQISTTMFNALLRAGVHTFSRRGHSIPSNYVTSDFDKGLGFDATVDYGHIDFKFTNDTGNTIYVLCYISKNKESGRRKNINVEVYGQAQPGVEYRCRNEILEKTPVAACTPKVTKDKTMLDGTQEQISKGHDGYKVTTYVDMYRDGVFVRCNYTETTVYEVIPAEVRIGTAVVTPAPTATPKATDTPAPEDPGSGEEP